MARVSTEVLIVGGGPAGLAAAESVAEAGRACLIADRMPSLGRKFLMAGKSGLNLTKDEEDLTPAYRDAPALKALVHGFGAREVRAWAEALGQPVFTGSSGRVFPVSMKASPLLRAWLARLTARGVEARTRWRLIALETGLATFETPQGPVEVEAEAIILALGGGSWARLGSDGAWPLLLARHGIQTMPFRPSNCGFLVDWSEQVRRFAGAPVKPVAITVGDARVQGEFVVSERGVEGSAVYAVSREIVDRMGPDGVTILLDLVPGRSERDIASRLARPRGKASLSNHLRKVLGLSGVRAALLREAGPLPDDAAALARRIKAAPIHLAAPAPLDEAISTAGGLPWDALDDSMMVRALPGVFAAGEMLDWDAPTGGYLITACLATGRAAGRGAVEWISR
ncbi:MAG: TIGR03862 family flavoprotein [Rubricella sp.]